MSIRQAKEKLVKVEEELYELRLNSSYVAVEKNGELPGLSISPDEYREKEKAKFARIEELLGQYEALGLAIEAARSRAVIDYKGRKINLHQAERLKEVLEERDQLCTCMDIRLTEAEEEVEKGTQYLTREREKAIRAFMGSDNGAKNADELKKLADIYEQMHKVSLCDPLGADDRLSAMRSGTESESHLLEQNTHEAEHINTIEL